MAHTTDIAIIGAGAAGLAAGIFAAEGGARVVLLDGADRIGAKILVSGGGRCNVTHDRVTPDDFNGSCNIIRNVLRAFDGQAAVRWFDSLGVKLKREDTGKLFPTTDSARTVLDALLGRLAQLGADVRTNCRVHRIDPPVSGQSHFVVAHAHGEVQADRVILATGGRSLPKTGSDGQGWAIARKLGHTVTDTHAALVPLVLADGFFHAKLAGVSQDVETFVHVDGKCADRRTGSLLWTHFGVSGPIIMDASRHWTVANDANRNVRLSVNLLPAESFETVERMLIDAAERHPRRPIAALLAERLPRRCAEVRCDHMRLPADRSIGQLSRDARRSLVHALVDLTLPVTKHRGWNYAEVTAGGISLDEIDYRTMASRKCSRLFLVGEILDVDGRIGGFNFQWAWSSGHVAGKAAASDG